MLPYFSAGHWNYATNQLYLLLHYYVITAAILEAILAAMLYLALPKTIETVSIIFLGWQNINRHKKYISGWNNKENMAISIISILMAAILDAILNSAKCTRVPGRHHSDSD